VQDKMRSYNEASDMYNLFVSEGSEHDTGWLSRGRTWQRSRLRAQIGRSTHSFELDFKLERPLLWCLLTVVGTWRFTLMFSAGGAGPPNLAAIYDASGSGGCSMGACRRGYGRWDFYANASGLERLWRWSGLSLSWTWMSAASCRLLLCRRCLFACKLTPHTVEPACSPLPHFGIILRSYVSSLWLAVLSR
jgi:hypothetical protein